MEEIPIWLTGKANCIALGKEKPSEMVNTKFKNIFQWNKFKWHLATVQLSNGK